MKHIFTFQFASLSRNHRRFLAVSAACWFYGHMAFRPANQLFPTVKLNFRRICHLLLSCTNHYYARFPVNYKETSTFPAIRLITCLNTTAGIIHPSSLRSLN